jgi:hypothetical protein
VRWRSSITRAASLARRCHRRAHTLLIFRAWRSLTDASMTNRAIECRSLMLRAVIRWKRHSRNVRRSLSLQGIARCHFEHDMLRKYLFGFAKLRAERHAAARLRSHVELRTWRRLSVKHAHKVGVEHARGVAAQQHLLRLAFCTLLNTTHTNHTLMLGALAVHRATWQRVLRRMRIGAASIAAEWMRESELSDRAHAALAERHARRLLTALWHWRSASRARGKSHPSTLAVFKNRRGRRNVFVGVSTWKATVKAWRKLRECSQRLFVLRLRRSFAQLSCTVQFARASKAIADRGFKSTVLKRSAVAKFLKAAQNEALGHR